MLQLLDSHPVSLSSYITTENSLTVLIKHKISLGSLNDSRRPLPSFSCRCVLSKFEHLVPVFPLRGGYEDPRPPYNPRNYPGDGHPGAERLRQYPFQDDGGMHPERRVPPADAEQPPYPARPFPYQTTPTRPPPPPHYERPPPPSPRGFGGAGPPSPSRGASVMVRGLHHLVEEQASGALLV